jgi:MYXO-CTERM domain-containing protein
MRRAQLGLISAVCAAVVSMIEVRRAEACGCFTPPDPSVPIVQAGERILFAVANGQVTAHIQIQYAGDAKDFGWLLPLPSVPTLQVGTDELFTALINTTQPKYILVRKYDDGCVVPGKGGLPTAAPGGVDDLNGGDNHLVVVQSSVGPYDYAVLHADKKDEMLAWMAANHYFVPAGTDGVVAPYIHEGAYFLALKLKSGESTGSLQPVVVKYASDLPMIPIVLTSVAAQRDMGIQVWMLGAGRAIPRNYYHTVIDEALLDWSNGAQNYNDVIIKATKEAEGRHTFVTEYAGSSSVMQNALGAPERFGSTTVLAAQPDIVSFLDYLAANGYPTRTVGPGGPVLFVQQSYSTQILGILGGYIPVPPNLPVASPSDFYLQASYYLGSYRQQHPDQFVGWSPDYQPAKMAAALDERIVQPTRAASALFDTFPYLTRLYTTLSPEQMDRDPVFSFNPGLPDYPNVHTATLEVHCSLFGVTDPNQAPSTLILPDGTRVEYPNGFPAAAPTNLPYSKRIEILSEEGAPQVVVDNGQVIAERVGSGGCGVAPAGGGPAGAWPALALAVLLAARRRRRRA